MKLFNTHEWDRGSEKLIHGKSHAAHMIRSDDKLDSFIFYGIEPRKINERKKNCYMISIVTEENI